MISYDRRVPDQLLDILRDGGWARSLVEYGRSGQYALALQLRNSPKKPKHPWASLYVGLTKVLDVHCHPTKGFRLSAHDTWKHQGHWEAVWDDYTKGMNTDGWLAVEAYLERVIPSVGREHLREGAVQAAVSAFRSERMTVIDREVSMTFATDPERQKITKRLQIPLLAALDESPEGKEVWWKNHPQSLGGELDALAIDKRGGLLAIEIKPNNASSTIPWAPVQVRHYANLITQWAAASEDATEVIDGMVEQRRTLGLISHSVASCRAPVTVRPVVAIQRGASKEVLRRLAVVHQRLIKSEMNDPPLEVYEVNLIGRLDRLDLPSLL